MREQGGGRRIKGERRWIWRKEEEVKEGREGRREGEGGGGRRGREGS